MPSGIKPSPETDARMIELYSNGLSAAKVAAAVGLTKGGVLGALARLGVKRRPPKSVDNSPLTEEVKAQIVSVYLSGKHTYETARIVGVSQRSVCKTLEQRGIIFRPIEEVNRNPGVNHEFFDSINTDAKAWVLGFLAADGWVVEYRNRIGVQVAAKDADVIDKIRALVCPGVDPKTKTRFIAKIMGKDFNREVTNVSLVWSSEQQSAALLSLGVVPRKTWVGKPWEGPSSLTAAYYRGLVDGNGCWPVSKGKVIGVGLAGTEPIVRGFMYFVRSICNTKAVPRKRADCEGWNIYYSVGIASEIARAFYKDATVWLARKRILAESIL